MSMMDAMDDALLGADDDELDYDLEKDEEDALLADDNYEDVYDEVQGEENQEQQYEEQPTNEEESDVLDIDSNVRLDEAEDDFGDQSMKENAQHDNDDEEEVEEQKERNRFLNERNITVQRTSEIPDTLEKVAVQPMPQQHNNNYNNNRNGRFQRGNRGRGRGRQNYNRGSVFGRVGNVQPEGKTVLINPHFRGNVQVSENARLVWDSNFQSNNNFPPQQRYPGPQMAQVAPFQSHNSPWINPQFPEQSNNFNQPHYQEPPPVQYQSPDMMAIRPLMQVNSQPPPFVPHQQQPPQQQMTNWCDDQSYCETMYPSQGNFRGRDIRFQNQAPIPPLMVNNPPPNFNRNNFNYPEHQNRPFVNPHHQNAPSLMQVQPNYPPPQQNFDQPPQHFIQQNQYNPNRHVQPVYDQYNDHNQHQNAQFPPPIVNNNQNYNGPNFQPVNYEPNFVPNQPPQESFPPKQYNQYNQNRPNNQNQRNHHQMNQYNNRSPPKRRSFENTAVSGDRDLPKKKKRSMELSNLHEVPTVDMPDTTTEEKEEEDEETRVYRLKIEEQKKLREKILKQKEERRKLAAAQKVDDLEMAAAPNRNVIPAQVAKQPNQQKRPQQQQQQPQPSLQPQQVQKPISRNQQRQRQMQRKQMQNNQRPQNIQVQANAGGQRPNQGRMIQQRRLQKMNQANIVITKNESLQQAPPPPQTLQQQQQQQQQQRIVMLKQNLNTQKVNPNRRVILKGIDTVNSDTDASDKNNQVTQDSANFSSFLSNRKVITNSSGTATHSVGLNQSALLETPIVVVSNLAAGTSEVKIRKLCQGLGPIQNIQMIPNQRQATIRFKNIVSAQKFFKKYQRKIVDLSMIQVTLEPES